MTDAPDPLERALREALAQLDPVPPHVVAAARAAYTWRTIDDELAALAFDSAADAELAGVRGSGPRALTFEVGEVVIDVEVVETADLRGVRGQVAGLAAPLPVLELQTPDRSMPLALDDLGRFAAADVPPGPVRLRCTFATDTGRPPVSTEWVVL